MLILFQLNASTGRNVCRFSLNPNSMVKNFQDYRIKSVHWTCHIGLSVQEQTKKQGLNDSFEKGKGFTLVLAGKTVKSFLRDGFSNRGDSKFLPTGWNKKKLVLMESKLFGKNLSSQYNAKCTLKVSYWPLY